MPLIRTYGRGLAPDRKATRQVDLGRSFTSTAHAAWRFRDESLPVAFAQPVAWIRNQLSFPSCVGFAFAACIDAKLGQEPWSSAVGIWREARRRQGRIEQIDEGTRLEYAVQGLVLRGWDPYTGPAEDSNVIEASKQDKLSDELFAFDKRLSVRHRRYRITEAGSKRVAPVAEALRAGYGVVLGIGTYSPFYSYVSTPSQIDRTLSAEALGGSSNGHAMRIIGYDATGSRWRFLLQNSWGAGSWGGCHLPSGQYQPGCCWVDERVIAEAWDIHCAEVKT